MLTMKGRLLMGDVLYHGTQKLTSQKSTTPTPVEPFQYSLNSAVLSPKDAFRFICASIFQVACLHETLKLGINFIFRSYAPVINEDKKCSSTHTTLLVNYKESPIETFSFLLWFCFCLRSVKGICLAISRNLSKRFMGFQQYRLV